MSNTRQEVAQERFQLIAPLLEPGIERAELKARRERILEQQKLLGRPISERTLRRYVQQYIVCGLKGLEPKVRDDRGMLRRLSRSVLEEAKILKEELPQRSVRQIIEILEVEGRAKPGSVSATTLGRHLRKEGLMDLQKAPKKGFRRFQKEYRNQLWQVDLKYGPFIPNPSDSRKKRRTYLVAFIDDYTRLVSHAQFYLDQRLPVLEDCFRKAILKRGIPDNVYVDNGKIFVSRWFRMACAKLNIRHMTTSPFSPEAKGKVERFMGTVDEFINEIALIQPKTLKELNEAFLVWLEEGYNHKPHASHNGQSPASIFAGDSRRLRFVTPEGLREAFLWEETRKVDKTGCVKLNGRLFDVGPELVSKRVDIRFDPFDMTEIEVWFNGTKARVAKELDLHGEQQRPLEGLEAVKPSESRYLKALREKEQSRLRRVRGAVLFHKLGGDGDV
jgi:putative transposase